MPPLKIRSHFILSDINYYVFTFKLFIRYNALTYMLYIVLIFKKYLYLISVFTFIITPLIDLLYLKPTCTTKHVPNFTRIPPQ